MRKIHKGVTGNVSFQLMEASAWRCSSENEGSYVIPLWKAAICFFIASKVKVFPKLCCLSRNQHHCRQLIGCVVLLLF